MNSNPSYYQQILIIKNQYPSINQRKFGLPLPYMRIGRKTYFDEKIPTRAARTFKDRFGVKIKLAKDNILTFAATSSADTNYIYAYDKNDICIRSW